MLFSNDVTYIYHYKLPLQFDQQDYHKSLTVVDIGHTPNNSIEKIFSLDKNFSTFYNP